jgi:DNA (cytosine-5)-methyltransferase 1
MEGLTMKPWSDPGWKPRTASLCSGYGGLERAAQQLWSPELLWYAENDLYASAVLAHHWPGIPNLGDITAADWAVQPRVDLLLAGFPCTDISNAGPRTGITGPRSGIWVDVAEAVAVLRPSLVLLENVAALRTRGLDTVVRDLARIGYALRWISTRASETGAPHPRHRWFGAAVPVSDEPLPGAGDVPAKGLPFHGEFTGGTVRERVRIPAVPVGALLKTPTSQLGTNGSAQHPDKRKAGGHGPTLDDEVSFLLPTPTTADGTGGHKVRGGARGSEMLLSGLAAHFADRQELLLPTPASRDWKSGASNLMDRNSRPLNEVVVNSLLPTPKASDGPHGGPNQRDAAGNSYLPARAVRLGVPPGQSRWTCEDGRDFGPAVERWEALTGFPAPPPAETGPRGGRRVAPPFVEWMMGLPPGYVTGLDLPRKEQLIVLGNGVVWTQAVAAYRELLELPAAARTGVAA